MRLLLVEDDRRIAADIAGALAAAGYVVETVRDGEEAWFRGDTEDYGAVILDLGLPGMDGLAVLKRWRSNGRHMPVLILTARASWAERVDGIDAGADDCSPGCARSFAGPPVIRHRWFPPAISRSTSGR
jgi:two-component system OmpR family response regulator